MKNYNLREFPKIIEHSEEPKHPYYSKQVPKNIHKSTKSFINPHLAPLDYDSSVNNTFSYLVNSIVTLGYRK